MTRHRATLVCWFDDETRTGLMVPQGYDESKYPKLNKHEVSLDVEQPKRDSISLLQFIIPPPFGNIESSGVE